MFRPHGSKLRELSFLQKVRFLLLRSSSRQHIGQISEGTKGLAKAQCSKWHHLVWETTNLSYYQHPIEPDRLQVPLNAIPQTTYKPEGKVLGEEDMCFGFALFALSSFFCEQVNTLSHQLFHFQFRGKSGRTKTPQPRNK